MLLVKYLFGLTTKRLSSSCYFPPFIVWGALLVSSLLESYTVVMKDGNFHPEIYNDPAHLTEKSVRTPCIYHSYVFQVQLFAIFDFGR